MGRSPFISWNGSLDLENRAIIKDSLKEVGIDHLADQLFSQLSDGQKQKALIARALAQKPELLILDEPTTFLDIPSRRELIKLLKKLAVSHQMVIILSTHDLDFIEENADYVWLMGKENRFEQMTPKDLKSIEVINHYFS